MPLVAHQVEIEFHRTGPPALPFVDVVLDQPTGQFQRLLFIPPGPGPEWLQRPDQALRWSNRLRPPTELVGLFGQPDLIQPLGNFRRQFMILGIDIRRLDVPVYAFRQPSLSP